MSNVTYHPYSDFALHHMGPRLADGISQGAAGPDQFRTAPLWGAGQRLFFLHDGRTSDLLQAESEGVDLETTSVEDVMSRRPLTVTPETELKEAALAMEYGEVHRLFVERDGQLVGVVSRSDVSRALATGRV